MRVFEEMRIPVDYAAGTSMGAIVGGLYASGMTPDELERAILEVDWADALRDDPSRQDLVFRRKDDDLRFIPELEVGIGKGGLRYPTGLQAGQKLNYLLRRLTMPVRTVNDFDRLPVPFRAVATDISNGSPVVLAKGDLARALRASMAIPTAFSPVEIDGLLLVDGGVSNNVPVDVVRAMGADVVIAIDIGSPLMEGEEVRRSFLTILSQTLGLITRANMAPRLADADLVITPAVADFGTLQFDKGAEIIELGEAEARAAAEKLRQYALPEAEYEAWRAARRREPDPNPVVSEVRIEGNRRVDIRALQPLVEMRAGEPFSPEVGRDDLSRIFGLADFESADLELEPDGDGKARVVYRLREKSWGPTLLRAGLNFRGDGVGGNSLSILLGLRRPWVNRLGAEWANEFELGERRSFRTELYQPLSYTSGWFVIPAIYYRRGPIPVFSGQDQIAELDVSVAGGSSELGYNFGRYGEVRLGLKYETVKPRLDQGVLPPELDVYDGATFDRAGATFSGIVDRLDSATLPKNGGFAELTGFYSLEDLGAEDEYAKIELRVSRFKTWSRHTVFGNLNAGWSPDEELPLYDRFGLGGLFSLTGFEPFELAGDNYGLVRLGYYFRLGKVLHVGGYGEAAQVSPEPKDLLGDPILTLTAIVVADTALGPVYLGFGGAEGGRSNFYFLFGRQF